MLTANPKFYWCSKYIKVEHHWIWDKVESKKISITCISTENIVADKLTNTFDPTPFKVFQTMIEMYWIGSHRIIEWEYLNCSHTVLTYYISMILCLLFRVSSVPCLICSTSHSVLRFIYSASHSTPHLFHISHILCLKTSTIFQLTYLVSTSNYVSEPIMLDKS